jgi:PAS domain S-box-containing protein
MGINLKRLLRFSSSYTGYGVAVISVLLSLLLLPLWGTRSPFLMLIPAVMVSSHYGGLGPGVLATILGGLLGLGFLPQGSQESIVNPYLGDLLRLGIFLAIGIFVSLLNRRLLAEKRLAESSSRSYQDSEERYRLLVEQIKDYAFYTIDPSGIVNTWNTGVERLKGYRAADILGRSFSICFPPEEVEQGKPARILQEAIAHGQWVDEGWHVRKDGSMFWAEAVITALRDERGRLRGFSQVVHDISDRKRAEQALSRYAERLETLHAIDSMILLARSLEDPVRLALTRICNLIPCQQAFILLFELESNQAQMLTGVEAGKPLPLEGTRVPIDDFVPVEMITQEPYRYIEDIEAHHHCSPGLKQFLGEDMKSCLTVPLLAEENLVGVLNLGTHRRSAFNNEHLQIAQEVANQLAIAIQQAQLRDQLQAYAEELEERVADRTTKLREANAELESFAYSVSHDLRSPLQAMQGLAQALLEDYTTQLDDLGQEYAKRICQSALRMDTLIENLLTYSRLNRTEIQLQTIPLEPVIQEALQLLDDQIYKSQGQIHLQGHLPSVLGHRSTLRQVVMNLVANALKFLPAGVLPEIEIGAEEQGDWVSLWVQDNGIGIREDRQERIFKVFERLHSLDAYPGTGIGLAIVRRGVERMGGQVTVDSQPGKGSCFCIRLPKPNHPIAGNERLK